LERSTNGHVIELVFDPQLWLIATAILVALTAGYALASRQRSKPADPLTGLFNPATFQAEAEATERRKPAFPQSPLHSNAQRTAILRGRIDRKTKSRALWAPETRADAVAQVAQVMRAGVRDGDEVQGVQGPEGGDSFVIVAKGASEEEASGIARRLLERIAETRANAMGDAMQFNTSFGVAQRRDGESDAELHARAEEALDAASRMGDDQVIMASDWDEVLLLPAPDPSPNPSEELAPSTDQDTAEKAA